MAKKSRTKGIYKKLGKDGAVTYAVRYYVPDESSPNGWKQQQKTFTKEAAAIEFKRDMTNKVKDGDYVAPVSFTVKEIGEKFLESKKHLKPQTHIGYQMAFTNYINPKFGSVKATSLRSYDIEAAATEWNERVAAINVNWVVNRLSNAYDFAKKLGIKVNPCNDVERRKDSRTPEETEKLALGEIADVGADQPDTPAGTLRPIRADETYSAAELKRIIDYARPGLDRAVPRPGRQALAHPAPHRGRARATGRAVPAHVATALRPAEPLVRRRGRAAHRADGPAARELRRLPLPAVVPRAPSPVRDRRIRTDHPYTRVNT